MHTLEQGLNISDEEKRMSEWLDQSEYMDNPNIPGLEIGEQIHFNHVGCLAGKDTKKRMYVKRMPDGYVAYCHHCNKRGSTKSKDVVLQRSMMSHTKGPVNTVPGNVRAPDLRVALEDWTVDAVLWASSFGMPLDVVQRHGISYDAANNRMHIPVYNADGVHIYSQLRALPGDTTNIKYINVDERPEEEQYYKPMHYPTSFMTDGCILTEDVLSSIAVSRVSAYQPIALLGTTLCKHNALELLDKYKYIALWLDSDKAGTDAALKLSMMLRPFVDVTIICTDLDPKCHTDLAIDKILGDHGL